MVPSSLEAANAPQAPQKLSGNDDVQFFAVGNLGGRKLVIYMKKETVGSSWSIRTRLLAKNAPQLGSAFRVLTPVIERINEWPEAQPTIGSRFDPLSKRSEWFRVYRVGLRYVAPFR